MENNYILFKKFFKIGEQVFVGFRQGDTHGYVSKFDEQGIYLIKINHAKEYFYKWNQCEVICHAGYLIKQVGQNETAKFIEIKLKRGYPIDYGAYSKIMTGGSSLNLLEDFRKDNFNFSISIKDTEKHMQKYFPDLWKLYKSPLFNCASKTIQNNKTNVRDKNDIFFLPDMDVNVKGLRWYKSNQLRINGNCITGSIDMSIQGMTCKLGNDFVERIAIRKPISAINIIKPSSPAFRSLPISDDSINRILNTTKTGLKKFIDDFRYVFSGDPYELSGKPILNSVFKSSQGFCLLNNHSELYAAI